MKKLFFLWAIILSAQALTKVQAQIRGAELSGYVMEQGKFKITIQTFYESSETEIPSQEYISVVLKGNPTKRTLELKKEGEVLKVTDRAPLANNPSAPLAIKAIKYSGVLNITGMEDIAIFWYNNKFSNILNNIDLREKDQVVLQLHITDINAGYNFYGNSFPDILNALSIKSDETKSFPVSLPVVNEKVMWNIKFGSLYISRNDLNASANAKEKASAAPELAYRPGFSIDQPAGKSLSYSSEKGEILFDHLPKGKYLLGVDIQDYRNTNRQPLYQGVFVIESTL